jgi:hypothetical protein
VLEERPVDEPLHVTLRRASLVLVARDVRARAEFAGRFTLIASEPELVAYVARRRTTHNDRFVRILARQLSVDVECDPRPALGVAAVFGSVGSAWNTWMHDPARDLAALVATAHDLLDEGLIRLSARRP